MINWYSDEKWCVAPVSHVGFTQRRATSIAIVAHVGRYIVGGVFRKQAQMYVGGISNKQVKCTRVVARSPGRFLDDQEPRE